MFVCLSVYQFVCYEVYFDDNAVSKRGSLQQSFHKSFWWRIQSEAESSAILSCKLQIIQNLPECNVQTCPITEGLG